MGIFKKIGDIARANVNALLDQLEDQKKLHEQAVLDLEEKKAQAKKLLISAKALLLSLEKKAKTLEGDIINLKKKAQEYLQNDDENTAKEMLRQKQAKTIEHEEMEKQIKHEQHALNVLHNGLNAIDEKISALKSRSSVASSKKHLEKSDAFDTFSRMEEKIEQKEFELEALNELLAEEKKVDKNPPSTSYDKHSDPDALEKELADIKRKIND